LILFNIQNNGIELSQRTKNRSGYLKKYTKSQYLITHKTIKLTVIILWKNGKSRRLDYSKKSTKKQIASIWSGAINRANNSLDRPCDRARSGTKTAIGQ
jgi:hypothetical protein